MSSRAKEIAKFACGFESFHTLLHCYLWGSRAALTIFGFTLSPALSGAASIISGTIAVSLGAYAWRLPKEYCL